MRFPVLAAAPTLRGPDSSSQSCLTSVCGDGNCVPKGRRGAYPDRAVIGRTALSAAWSGALLRQRHDRAVSRTLVTMQVDDQVPRSHQPLRQSAPDVRPLGLIAIGFALVSLLLAPSYFLTLFAYLTAVPAAVFGFMGRGELATRTMGNAALVITGAAIVCATCVVLFVY